MPNGNPTPGPLNSRYFRPVRGKETRARRWDLQFESTSLQRRVTCELDFRGRTHLCRFVSRCGGFEVTETSKLHFKNLAYSAAPTRLVAFLCPSREISGRVR